MIKPCLHCDNDKDNEMFEGNISTGPITFVRCGNEICQATATLVRWNHPISQSQVCMVCTTKEAAKLNTKNWA